MLNLNDVFFSKDDEGSRDLTEEGIDFINTLIIFEDPFSSAAIECLSKKINVNAEDLNEFLKDEKNGEFREIISEWHADEVEQFANDLEKIEKFGGRSFNDWQFKKARELIDNKKNERQEKMKKHQERVDVFSEKLKNNFGSSLKELSAELKDIIELRKECLQKL